MSRSGSHYNWHGKPKIGHILREAALDQAKVLTAMHPWDKMNVYYCWCRRYHVGHEKKPHNQRPDPVAERLVGRLIGVLRGTQRVSAVGAGLGNLAGLHKNAQPAPTTKKEDYK